MEKLVFLGEKFLSVALKAWKRIWCEMYYYQLLCLIYDCEYSFKTHRLLIKFLSTVPPNHGGRGGGGWGGQNHFYAVWKK